MVPYALKAGDMAGAVVVVVKDGTVLLEKGYGFADVSKKLRNGSRANHGSNRVHLEAVHVDSGDAAGGAGQARSRPEYQ